MTPEYIDELFTYHSPNEEQIQALAELRAAARVFARKLNESLPDCADKTAALRKLRECVMTANAAIVLPPAS